MQPHDLLKMKDQILKYHDTYDDAGDLDERLTIQESAALLDAADALDAAYKAITR